MKIAIAGAGIAGAYLNRFLRNQGYRVDLFDRANGTKCGLTPCAWGTSNGFDELVEAAGLDPEGYILKQPSHLLIDNVRLAAELMTFDKPKLVTDLLRGVEIRYAPLDPSKYDRIIDATGVSRAFLPAIEDDILLPCIQYRIQTEAVFKNRIKLGSVGYAWSFPLAEGIYHIGCGSLVSDPHKIMEELGWLSGSPSRSSGKTICWCEGDVRLTAPLYSQPFVSNGPAGEVWGVGEAIGCVAPLAGDGVLPAMRSVQILLSAWDDPEEYTGAILEEFDWMTSEREVIDKLNRGDRLGVRDAWVLKKNSRRMGIRIGLRDAAKLVRNLR